MKVRVISYYEVEDKFKQVLTELSNSPVEEETVVQTGSELLLLLNLCISQMKSPDAASYTGKRKHLAVLEKASAAITYKINTCTVEQITDQVNAAYRGFGTQ